MGGEVSFNSYEFMAKAVETSLIFRSRPQGPEQVIEG